MVIFQLKPDDWCIILIVLLNLNCQLESSGKMTWLVSHLAGIFLHGQGALQGNLPLSWLNSREQHHLQETEKKEKVLVAQSCQLFVTPWTITRQAPLSMGFSRQEHWSGLPFLSSGDLPDPGIEPRSPALQEAESPPGRFFTIWATREAFRKLCWCSDVETCHWPTLASAISFLLGMSFTP